VAQIVYLQRLLGYSSFNFYFLVYVSFSWQGGIGQELQNLAPKHQKHPSIEEKQIDSKPDRKLG
jgi:hypothetical protein